jgi:hypothetical protein
LRDRVELVIVTPRTTDRQTGETAEGGGQHVIPIEIPRGLFSPGGLRHAVDRRGCP